MRLYNRYFIAILVLLNFYNYNTLKAKENGSSFKSTNSLIVFDGFASSNVGPSPSNQPEAEDPFRYFQVYLPEDYNNPGNCKRYPVIYFLHGFGLNYSSYGQMFNALDKLIATKQLDPVIVVKVDASIANGYLGSFYANSTLNGNFETYIVEELRAYINKNYRTKTSRKDTQVAGHGMGGYGALLYAVKHPDIYGAVTAHSPEFPTDVIDLGFNPISYTPVLAEIPATGPAAGKVLPANGPNTFKLFAMSAALSPDALQQFGVDLPIVVNPDYTPVLTNGLATPNISVLNRWLLNDPTTIVRDNVNVQKALRHTRIYIDVGSAEKNISPAPAILFSRTLTSLNIPHTFIKFQGSSFDHADIYTPSNDIAVSQVYPVLLAEANLLTGVTGPFPTQLTNITSTPSVLTQLIVEAVNTDPIAFSNVAYNTLNPLLTNICNITPPPFVGDLLISPAFQACLTSVDIDPAEFIEEFFGVAQLLGIFPPRFSIDDDAVSVVTRSRLSASIGIKYCGTPILFLPV